MIDWIIITALMGQLAQSNCDPAYPDVCIAPYPPDLNCDDISHTDFRVYLAEDSDKPANLTRLDPHRFDRDKNGIGCETRD